MCVKKEGRDVVLVNLLMLGESSTMKLHDENMSPGASWWRAKGKTYLLVSLERVE
jgi:hypothetical protein